MTEALATVIIGLIGTVLGVILTKITERYFDKKKEETLFLADITDVLEWGWDGKKLLRHLIALDYETTDNLNESNEGTPDQWAPVFMDNPDCWKLLASRKGELVGYWSFFALKDSTFKVAKQGKLNEGEIKISNVQSFNMPGTFNIYISIVCIRENYRKKGFLMLFDSFITRLNELTQSNRKINNICVNAFSEDGKLLAKNFGLRYLCSHVEYGEIFFGKYQEAKNSKLARGKLL